MPSNLQLDSAEIWLSALRAAGRSPKTLETYAHAVRQLREWRQTDEDLSTVGKLEARAFASHLGERFQPGGVAVRIRSLRACWSWLLAEQMVTENVFARIKISVPDVSRPTASDAQIEAMLTSSKRSRRDLAMLTLMVDTGARRGEVAALTLADVDLTSGTLRISVSKSRQRSVALSDRAVVAVARYLRERGVRPGGLWDSADPHSMVNAVCLRHSKGKLRAHSLRRAFAIRWLERGGSEIGLCRVAGWSSLEMARIYSAASADRLADQEMRRLMA